MPVVAGGTSSNAAKESLPAPAIAPGFIWPSAALIPDHPRICRVRRREIILLNRICPPGLGMQRSAAPRGTLRLRPDPAWILLGDLPLNGHLANSVLFAPRARIGEGKLVMSGRVRRQHLHVALERGDGFRKAFGGIQGHAQGEECFGKPRIQSCRGPEVRNCFIPLSGAPCDLSQPEGGCCVARINL